MRINTRLILMTAVIASALIAASATAYYPQWGTFSPITPDTNPFVEQDVSMARYYTDQGDYDNAGNFLNQAKGMLPYDPDVNAAEVELEEAKVTEEVTEEPVEEVAEEITEGTSEGVTEETTEDTTPTVEPTPEVE